MKKAIAAALICPIFAGWAPSPAMAAGHSFVGRCDLKGPVQYVAPSWFYGGVVWTMRGTCMGSLDRARPDRHAVRLSVRDHDSGIYVDPFVGGRGDGTIKFLGKRARLRFVIDNGGGTFTLKGRRGSRALGHNLWRDEDGLRVQLITLGTFHG